MALNIFSLITITLDFFIFVPGNSNNPFLAISSLCVTK